jgi:hypothetical protein
VRGYTTGPSIFETESSETPAAPADTLADGQGEPFRWTIAPWKIGLDRDGNQTKILGLSRKIRTYEYGTTTWDYSPDDSGYEWLEGLRLLPLYLCFAKQEWLRARICSRQSGLIVVDVDARDQAPGFFQSTGIPESPYRVSTRRGDHYYYDGRGLAPDDFPVHGPVSCGDLMSAGFVPEPGCPHPKGGRYELDSAGKLPKWLPEYTEAVRSNREAMGRRPGGSYEHTKGAGRNNALYDLKKKLFYEELLDEDDPELHRRIYAANQMFPVPLDEEEVRVTILRIKGWKRHGHFSWAELEYADPDVSAGSEISVQRKEIDKAIKASRDVKKCSDLREAGPPRRQDTVRRVEAKLKAEQDIHPRSIDWFRAPPGAMELYSDLADLGIESLKAGAEFAQLDASLPCASLGGAWRQQLEWLLHGNGAPLIEYHGGLVYLLSDPVYAELPRYPGVPEGVNPKAGKSLGEKLDHLIVLVRSCPGGDALTQREVAAVINHPWFRATFGLEEYRYVSVSAMSQVHVRGSGVWGNRY